MVMPIGVIASSVRLPILDRFDNIHSAYGLRRLLSSYTTNRLIRIREDGGDTELDIGWDSKGDLDTAAAAAHIGANNGFIVTWYDQSGNSRDMSQPTDSQQPTYTASAMNSRPGVTFVQANSNNLVRAVSSDALVDELQVTSVAVIDAPAANALTTYAEASNVDNDPIFSVAATTNGGSSNQLCGYRRDDSGIPVSPDHVESQASGLVWADAAPHVGVSLWNNGTLNWRVDGAAGTQRSYTHAQNNTVTHASIGSWPRATPAAEFDGIITELVLFDTIVLTADLETIEADISRYWGTP